MEIVIATKNEGKVREIRHFLCDSKDIFLRSLNDYKDVPEIIESGLTFRENSIIKAKLISEYFNVLALADDSGLEVDILNNRPGVYSSRYSGENATDKSNRKKIIRELSSEKDIKKRTARFVCSMVLWDSKKGLVFEAREVCEGFIGFDEKGAGGFGYDSLFIPEGYEKTMAQLTEDEKNKISHRGKALIKFAAFISK